MGRRRRQRLNNMAASTDTIHISVPVLPYNTPVAVTVAAGKNRYYRLDVAGGEYVVLSATFNTVLHAELLVLHGGFPTRSDYDHAAVGLYDLQREITLPRFLNGADYLYLHGREGPSPSLPISLNISLQIMSKHVIMRIYSCICHIPVKLKI